ncbi:MAG: HNH endonuclease signature motif containing protein, partial [Terracoccus sp.]
QWTDAHHVRHWLHGGTTSLGNLALLCRRHHVYVHKHDLTATITATKVTWHTWQHWATTAKTDADLGPPPRVDATLTSDAVASLRS